jgi:hypothetical protein
MDDMCKYITYVLDDMYNDDLIQVLLYIDNDNLSGKLLVLMEGVYNYRISKLVNSKCDIGISYSDEVNYLDKFYFYQNYHNRVVMCIREELVNILYNRYELYAPMTLYTSKFIESNLINPSLECLYNL